MTEKTPFTDITNNVTFKIAVDLDGTLAEYDYWRGPDHIGAPIRNTVWLLRNFHSQNTEIFIFTCRTNKTINREYDVDTMEVVSTIRKWLNDNNLPFVGINLDDGKPFAHVYLDDRATYFSKRRAIWNIWDDINRAWRRHNK